MYKPLQRNTIILLVVSLLGACSPAQSTATPAPVLRTPQNTPIPVLEDEEMNVAIRQAQETLYIWRHEFLAPKRFYSIASLKVRFIGAGNVEDMWTEPLYILDDRYTVRMLEGVTLDQGIHPNRLLDLKAEDIIDWMLLADDGTLSGGYTLRLEYKRMTPEQQKRYIEVTGIRFDKAE